MSTALPTLRCSLQRIVEHPLYRVLAWGSLAYLTYLLLIPDPLSAAGMARPLAETLFRSGVLHLLAYFCVALAVFTLQAFRSPHLSGMHLGMLLVHAFLTELAQHWVVERTADLRDVTANVAGIAIAAMTYLALCRVFNTGLTVERAPRIID